LRWTTAITTAITTGITTAIEEDDDTSISGVCRDAAA
jgi:hypothetical protein